MTASRPLQELWEGLPVSPRLLGRPPDLYRTSGSPSRPFPDPREDLPTPPETQGAFNPSQTSGKASRPLLDLQDALPTTLGPSGGYPDHFLTSGRTSHPSRTSGMASQPFPELWEVLPDLQGAHPDLQEGVPTPPVPLGRAPSPSGGPLDHFHTSGRAS